MKAKITRQQGAGTAGGGRRRSRSGLFKRAVASLLMLLLAGATAISLASPAKAADDTANYSFYKLSSSLAAFFSNAQSPDDKAEPLKMDVWRSVVSQPGSAGSMLGYLDPGISLSMEFLNSQISGSSAAIGYDTLIQSTQGGGDGSTDTPGMLDYAHFGAAVNAMGLDSMTTGLSMNFLQPLGGSLMMLLYIFTGVVDVIFASLIDSLKALNPFTLFFEGVKAVSPKFAEGMTGGQAPPGFLGGLSSWIGQWYRVLNDMSWTVMVPLFIALLLLGLLLRKNMDRGSAIRKTLIRLIFIGIGLPLIGGMYTGVLNSMGDATKGGTAGSTQVVLSTYVDFQNWALKNRLAVPSNGVIEWDASGHKPTTKALANVRGTALEINKATNPAWAGIGSTLNVASGASWTDAAMKNSVGNASGGILDSVGGTSGGDSAGGLNGYLGTIDLLARYIGAQKVEAASFETAAKGDISSSYPYQAGADGKKQVSGWFTNFSDPKTGLPAITDPGVVSGNPVLRVEDGSGLTATPAGKTSGTKTFTSPRQAPCYAWVSNSMGEPRQCNMSALSLYNYLNTSFSTTSMTVYSSNKATSGATREMHSSVTQVGTGTMSGLYWLNSIVLLGSFVVIGVGYAFSVLFANIKRSFQLVTAIPFASIGAMAGIAKVVIYSLSMILEVIVTLFIYRFMQMFLISIPQIVEMPFSAVLNSGGALGDSTTVNLLSGGTLPMVMTVLSIIGLLIFTVLALRTRKSIVKAINEVVTKLVDKFMDANVTPPGGKGGMMPALAGGMASGAGMAAANRIMSGGASGPKKSAGAGNGPSKVSTGGVPPMAGPGSKPGGPAGELTVGGGEGPDGQGGGPGDPGGNGNPGSPLALGQGPGSESGGIADAGSNDQETARTVAAQGGLSEPGNAPRGDITDSVAGSLEASRAQYAAKDKAAVDSAAAGGKAAVKGVEAVGRGAAGDVAGAAKAGAAAANHGSEAREVKRNAQAPQQKPSVSGPRSGGQSTASKTSVPTGPKPATVQPSSARTPKAQANAPTGAKPARTQTPSSRSAKPPVNAPKPPQGAPAAPQRPAQAPAQPKAPAQPRVVPAPRAAASTGPANRDEPAAPKAAPRPVRRKDREA